MSNWMAPGKWTKCGSYFCTLSYLGSTICRNTHGFIGCGDQCFPALFSPPRIPFSPQVLRLSAGFSQPSLRQTLGCALRCLLLTRPAGKSSRRRVTSDTEHEWSTASPETSVSSSPPGGAGGPPTLPLTAVPPSRDAPPQVSTRGVWESDSSSHDTLRCRVE